MMQRHAMPAEAVSDGGRTITVTVSTETLGRDDISMVSAGIDLTAYRTNPIVLWQHNPDRPIARAEHIGVTNGKLVAKVRFADAGISEQADEIFGLIKCGIINTASTGVEIRRTEPINPSAPNAGIRVLTCELQEFSFVSIPAVPDALVTERSKHHQLRGRGTNASGRAMIAHRRMATLYAAELARHQAEPRGWIAGDRQVRQRMAMLYEAEIGGRPAK
jgi:hypothetical protein